MNNKRASIDIGSNSILLLAGEFNNNQFVELLNESNVTGLGRDLDVNKKFLDISMQESLEVLKQYSDLVKSHDIDPADVVVTATEAARVAQNASSFFDKVKQHTGLNVQIISGQAEAYYSSKGIMFNTQFEQEQIVIMDIGGASTEIIEINTQTGHINTSFSMPFGAVRVTNWISNNEQVEKISQIKNDFSKELNSINTSKLFCVAGTMTSVANMYLGHKDFQEKKIHGLSFGVQEVQNLLQKHQDNSPDKYLEHFPFLGKRSKTITGGMIVATTVFSWLNIDNIEISTYGLRYGTLEEGFIADEYLVK